MTAIFDALAACPQGALVMSECSPISVQPHHTSIAAEHPTHGAGHSARVFDLSFGTAVPELLASASDDESVKVWRALGDGGPLQLVSTFTDHTDSVMRVSWSPDGRVLASGADHST